MGFIKDLKARQRVAKYLSTAQEQALYALVVDEIANDGVVPGLWAMAIAKSGGDESKAKAKYLELRVDLLREELAVSEEVASALRAERKQRDEAQRVDDEQKREELAALEAALESERPLTQFLEGSGYSLDIRNNEDERSYRVTAPQGASIGFENLCQLQRFADGVRARSKEAD